MEGTSVEYRGVVLVSETEEEKGVLWDIWNSSGAPVTVGKLDNGSVELVVAPTPQPEARRQQGE